MLQAQEIVFNKLQDDKVSLLVENDPIIVRFTENLFNKHHAQAQYHQFKSTKLREIGLLILQVRVLNFNLTTVNNCLTAYNFRTIKDSSSSQGDK